MECSPRWAAGGLRAHATGSSPMSRSKSIWTSGPQRTRPASVCNRPRAHRAGVKQPDRNAFKFTTRGGVCVVSAERLRDFRNRAPASDCSPSPSATRGSAYPRTVERIFEAFQQGDARNSRKYGGTGLGLSICGRSRTARRRNHPRKRSRHLQHFTVRCPKHRRRPRPRGAHDPHRLTLPSRRQHARGAARPSKTIGRDGAGDVSSW